MRGGRNVGTAGGQRGARRRAVAKLEKVTARRFPKSAALALGLLTAVAAMPAGAGDVLRGGSLYAQHCSNCHGPGGRPVLPTAPDFTQHGALLKPDLALLASIRRGRGAMPSYDGVLRDQEILDIVTHLRTLRR